MNSSFEFMSKVFFLLLVTLCMVFIGRVAPIYNPEVDNYEVMKPTP